MSIKQVSVITFVIAALKESMSHKSLSFSGKVSVKRIFTKRKCSLLQKKQKTTTTKINKERKNKAS